MAPASWIVLLGLMAQVPPPNAAETVSQKLRQERDEIRNVETKQIQALADDLVKAKDPEAAKEVLAFVDPGSHLKNGASRFRPLPQIVPPPAANAKPWGKTLDKIRTQAADGFEALAQKALKLEPARYALADECLRAVVARSPNRPAVWRLLGYLPHEGGWATPFAIQQLKEGYVLHPVFGWVEKDWVSHLDQGQLPAPHVAGRPTRWLAASEADAMRRQWGKGWQIKSEHFAIATNVPLAEAITFGNRLEALHDLFESMMADVIGPELQLAQLSKNPKLAPTPTRKRHKVYYFAEKDEYVRQLLPVQGEAASTSLGTYLPPKLSRPRGNSASYFFRDTGGQLEVTATLYHEVSHQLLFESAGSDRYDDRGPNYWVFEGLGTYFETLTPQPDGSLQIGELTGPRIEQARIRLVKNREAVPVEQFVRYNKNAFNGDTGEGDIYLHYAQAMALTVYLMQAKDEAYREPFLDHVRDVYKGRTSKTLQDRLGSPFRTLNQDLINFLKNEPAAPPAR